MKYIIKSIIFAMILYGFVFSNELAFTDVFIALNLVIATLFIDSKNKYIKITALAAEVILVSVAGGYTDFVFWAMLILLFDIVYIKYYYIGIIILMQILYFKIYSNAIEIWPIIILVVILAYIIRQNEEAKNKYHNILDNERRTKYNLELAQQRLIKTNREVEKLAEAKERNRIARDVHDNVGHSIAGILIKLQATKKVLDKDKQKGDAMLDECVVHLQDSLQMLRDTVHNMYNYKSSGTEHIKSIVDNYKYCNADINISGHYKNCSQEMFKALSYVLKEALTNTAKHSEAQNVYVELKGSETEINLDIKDDGIGCADINESLGIKSMRDRIRGLMGTLEIDGRDGMHILCSIPIEKGNI